MKKVIYLFLLVIIFTNCSILLGPIFAPIAESIFYSRQEMQIDSCEQTLLTIVMLKRYTEHQFTDDIEQLEKINSLDTLNLTNPEIINFNDSLLNIEKELAQKWKNQCKFNFDSITLHPYSVDSLQIEWTKTKDLKNTNKMISHDSWLIKVVPDSLFKPYYYDLKLEMRDFNVEMRDSTGKIVSTMNQLNGKVE